MRIKSGFDFHRSCGHLPDVMSRLKEIRYKVAPISDSSTFSFVQWTKLAKTANLRPIYGATIRVGNNSDFSFFAKTSLRPLNDLFAKPLSYADALAAKGLIKIAGITTDLSKIKPQADLYVALSPALPRAQFNETIKRGFRFIASSENVYPRESDREFYRIVLGKRASLVTYPQWILSDKEWRRSVAHLTDDKLLLANALKNRDIAMSLCHATLKKATLLVPDKPKSLKVMCEEGAKRLGVDVTNDPYLSRLSHELDTIKKCGNGDYFYIISDLMNYARQHMLVGPGRGSSCGSLVCFLLGITSVDPIVHGLLFERFLDVTRTDAPPDVDLDFPDQKRHLIVEYLQAKYGKDHVAKLGTVGTFGAKSALNQACRSLNIPKWEAEEALSQLITRADGDARSTDTLFDTLSSTSPGQKFATNHPGVQTSARLEGHTNFAGCHAGGVLVVAGPITDHAAVSDGVAQCDLKSAEELGLLKIDCLGLSMLSVLERAMELINAH